MNWPERCVTPPNDRLDAVPRNRLRPLNQAEAKAALASLKAIGRSEPLVAALIDGDTPLRDFICVASNQLR